MAFVVEIGVRDYECDTQGVVNNAVYQNYLEHARHRFIESIGLKFTKLHEHGVDVTLARAEIRYIKALRSGDKFKVVTSVFKSSPIRYIFKQEIVNIKNNETVLKADMTVATLNASGRPARAKIFEEALKDIVVKEGE